jgi:hypothetical protein
MNADCAAGDGNEPTMLAVVLRLLSTQLAAGEVTGFLEVVGTGERRALRNADDLVAALAALGPPGAT